MAKDAVATMGEILPDDAGGRDAVHVAVVSAMASEKLFPGQDVGIGEQQGRDYEAIASAALIGIVDPYLKMPVLKGERFWLYLYPRSITGLNHHWTHPAFPDDARADASYAPPSAKLDAEKWLRDWAGSADCPGYEWFIAEAANLADGGGDGDEYLLVRGRDAHGDIPDEAWSKAEIVLGRSIKVPRPAYFSCSC